MKEKIGTDAGIIWSYLDIAGKQPIKKIKKSCKLTDKELYAALGWLAREGKIAFNELKEDIEIALV